MPSRKSKIKEEEQPLFLDSINVMDLPVNAKLEPLRILKTSGKKKSAEFNIKFKMPGEGRLFNIYLWVNGTKKDMFYQVYPGSYTFRGNTEQGENLFELFYSTTTFRSATVFSFLNKGLSK
jgi:hypothetical protein